MMNTKNVLASCFALALAWTSNQGTAKLAYEVPKSEGTAPATTKPDTSKNETSNTAGVTFKSDALYESKVGLAAKFVKIKASEFEMGSHQDDDQDTDELIHSVKLTKDFEMQATNVTQLQYFLVTGRAPSNYRKATDCDAGGYKVYFGREFCLNNPVENVSWTDAQAFISELNKIQDRFVYRLPTESEWEYAARGGMSVSFPYSFGYNDTGLLNEYAWYAGNSENRPHSVASKKPNAFGLYDMHGNVWQWVQDYYGSYVASEDTMIDPVGPLTGVDRVIRGGAWNLEAQYVRSAYRFYSNPMKRDTHIGFRIVRTTKSPK